MNSKRLTIVMVVGVSATVTLILVWMLSIPGSRATAMPAPPLSNAPSPRYVCITGTNTGNCTDSGSPCRTVQYAVDQASEGSVIKVASGLYTGVHGRTTNAPLEEPTIVTQVVYITKSVTIQGGYTTINGFADPPDPIANPTTLDAQRQGRVIYISRASSVTVAGLHITGGDAIGLAGGQWIQDSGGGVFVAGATATLSNNTVFGNVARDGGGVYVSNSTTTLRSNQVFSNSAGNSGGGMCVIHSDDLSYEYNIDTTVAILGNQVFSNTAGSSGGGIYVNNDTFYVAGVDGPTVDLVDNQMLSNVAEVDGLSVNLVDNQVFGNVAGYEGGGIFVGRSYMFSGPPTVATLVGNTVAGNRAESHGGGLLLRIFGPTLNRNRFIANTADYGGGVFLARLSGGTFYNTIIADNWADTAGSGLYSQTSLPSLRHATIARNRGGDGSGLLISWQSTGSVLFHGRVDLVNVIVASQTVGITMSRDLNLGFPAEGTTLDGVLWFDNGANIGGMGTITITQAYTGNPAFVDPDNGNYHIGPGSAAIDAGVDAGTDHDVDDQPRPFGAGYDIGADEYYPTLLVSKQAYPDPVEPGAQLTYTIRVTNTGGATLTTTVTDTLPAHVTLGQTSGGTLALPGGTVVLPDGRVAVTWTAVIIAPGDPWAGTILVTVNEGYDGPLINLVDVMTEEGVMGKARVLVNARKIYLPLVLRESKD